jgi:hypothetical protein
MVEGGDLLMNARTMTLEQIRESGLKVLVRELGPVGMVRFIQQFEKGTGDYTKERHRWLGSASVRMLTAKARARRRAKSHSNKKK